MSSLWIVRADGGGYLADASGQKGSLAGGLEPPARMRLVDLREAKLVEGNYESVDREGQTLLPLRQIYRPAS